MKRTSPRRALAVRALARRHHRARHDGALSRTSPPSGAVLAAQTGSVAALDHHPGRCRDTTAGHHPQDRELRVHPGPVFPVCADRSVRNSIHLANSGLQRLVSATVAMRNWTLRSPTSPSRCRSSAALQHRDRHHPGRATQREADDVQRPRSASRRTRSSTTRSSTRSPSPPRTTPWRASTPNADGLNVRPVELAVPASRWVGHHAGDGVGRDRCWSRNRRRLPVVHHAVRQHLPVGDAPTAGLAAAGDPVGLRPHLAGHSGERGHPRSAVQRRGRCRCAAVPGEPPQPVDFAITNPGGGPVHVSDVKTTITGTNKGVCNLANPAPGATTWYQMTPPSDATFVVV